MHIEKAETKLLFLSDRKIFLKTHLKKLKNC